jgi:hypothetical protein
MAILMSMLIMAAIASMAVIINNANNGIMA